MRRWAPYRENGMKQALFSYNTVLCSLALVLDPRHAQPWFISSWEVLQLPVCPGPRHDETSCVGEEVLEGVYQTLGLLSVLPNRTELESKNIKGLAGLCASYNELNHLYRGIHINTL